MWETHWLALAAFATIMTLLWLVVIPEERVYFTAGLGGGTWIFVSLTARGVERMTTTGEVVAADPGVLVQLFTGILGLLSLLVVVLYKADLYPPPEDDGHDDERMKA